MYGNVISQVDAVDVESETIYDAVSHQYPEQVIVDPIGLAFQTTRTFDRRSGQVLTETDPKGLTTRTDYDEFYRPIATTLILPGAPATEVWKERTFYQLDGVETNGSSPVSHNRVHKQVNDGVDPAFGLETFTYSDGLGRSIQTRTEAEDGQFRVTGAFLNGVGNKVFEPRVQRLPGSDYGPLVAPIYLTQTIYDPIQRVKEVKPPIDTSANSPTGSTLTAFIDGAGNKWVAVETDAEGKVRRTYADARGNTVAIVEETGSSNFVTRYTYDLLDNLLLVEDSKPTPNVTEVGYDSLRRRISLDDPDMGHWEYFYDDAGRLSLQVDAKDQAIESVHDAVGRVTQRRIWRDVDDIGTGSPAETETFHYDSNMGEGEYSVFKGQLFKVQNAQGWMKHSYDVRGRLLRRTCKVFKNNKTYTTRYSYDDADHVIATIYPGQILNTRAVYDTGGHLAIIQDVNSGLPYVATTGFDDQGDLNGLVFGNGVSTAYFYAGLSKRLTHIKTGSDLDLPDQLLSYFYDKVSNVTGLFDLIDHGPTSDFSLSFEQVTYDDLHRLTSYVRNGQQVDFVYDRIGNVLRNDEAGPGQLFDYLYQSNQPHAVTSANGKAYAYDGNGNMTDRNGQLLVYDEKNRLDSVTDGSSVVTFGYDTDGQRLWRQRNGDSPTIWIGSEYEERDGQRRCHILANGKRVCTAVFEQVSPGSGPISGASPGQPAPGVQLMDVFYYHNDHLMSAGLVTNSTGAVCQQYSYKVYGAESSVINSSVFDPSNRYTGQVLDDETGLYYYNARYYDPELARFIQPDAIVPDASNPQALNRYAYALNSPLLYSDPSGHFSLLGILYWFQAMANDLRPDDPRFVSVLTGYVRPPDGLGDAFWGPGRGAIDGFFDDDGYLSYYDRHATLGRKSVRDDVARTGYWTGRLFGQGMNIVLSGDMLAIGASGFVGNAGKLPLHLSKDEGFKVWLTNQAGTLARVEGGAQRFIVSPSGTIVDEAIVSRWADGTFGNTVDSIDYHFNVHGAGRTPWQYTDDACVSFGRIREVQSGGSGARNGLLPFV